MEQNETILIHIRNKNFQKQQRQPISLFLLTKVGYNGRFWYAFFGTDYSAIIGSEPLYYELRSRSWRLPNVIVKEGKLRDRVDPS